MVYCVGHNIISPLGRGSKENYESVKAGRSGLKRYVNRFADVEPFCASLFDTPQSFVSLCIESIEMALEECHGTTINTQDAQAVFILSTTKGDNLELLKPAQQIAPCNHSREACLEAIIQCLQLVFRFAVAFR